MGIEHSIDKLADAILALAAAISTKQEAPATPGKPAPTPPAPTPPAATKAVKTEPAAGSPSEGKSAAKEEEPASTPGTAGASGVSSPKVDDSEKRAFDYETEVKPLFLQLLKEKGREVAVGLIAEYDPTPGKKLNEVTTPEQYGEVIGKIKAILGVTP